jgi:hypothetical protein
MPCINGRSISPRVYAAMRTPNAAVYDTCPLFLVAVIAVFAVADLGASVYGLPAPHETMSPLAIVIGGGLVGYLFAIISRARTLWHWFCCFSAGMILPLGNAIMPAALTETSNFLPKTYDERVAQLDAAFGLQLSFLLARVMVDHAAIKWVCSFVYATVLLPPALLAIAEGYVGRRVGIGALPTFLAIAGVGFCIYHILPVVGPRVWFGDAFPLHVGRHSAIEPRNAMPSLHIAWVLMAFLCARGMMATRFIIGIWLTIMLVATMGLGEHYLIDLVCAVPFVVFLRALCASELSWSVYGRWSAIVVGGSILFIWGLVVRGVIDPAEIPGTVPALSVCTVILSVIWERGLAKAQGILPSPGYLDRADAIV